MSSRKEKINEIISAYFSNIVFTTYDTAIVYFNNQRFESIETSYIFSIEQFNKAFSNNESSKYCKEVLIALKDYCNEYLEMNMNYEKFIDSLLYCIVDDVSYTELKNQYEYKEYIVKTVLQKSVQQFVVYICQQEVKNIIELKSLNYNSESYQKKITRLGAEWKNLFKQIFTNKARDFYLFLIANRNGVTTVQDSNTVSCDVFEELENKFRICVKEKQKLSENYNKLLNYIKLLKTKIDYLENQKTQEKIETSINIPSVNNTASVPTATPSVPNSVSNSVPSNSAPSNSVRDNSAANYSSDSDDLIEEQETMESNKYYAELQKMCPESESDSDFSSGKEFSEDS